MEEKKAHDTKVVIMEEALQLFAQRGYAAVSMRDIAAAVGIRASSIYHHFKGKQEIFDALVQQAHEIKDHLQKVFLTAFDKVGTVEEEPFIQAGLFFVTDYLQNEKIRPLLKVLECERFHESAANQAWSELLFQAPMQHEENVFLQLQNNGLVIRGDAKELAAEYQSAILLAYFTDNLEQLRSQLSHFYKYTFK